MNVISVISQKGGCGKTTLTLSLAVAAQRAGKTTAIIDLDPQPTISKWSDRREEETPVVISAQAARLHKVLKSAQDTGADMVFIDTPPRAADAAHEAAKAGGLVLIPCSDSIFDLETVETTVNLLRLAGVQSAIAVLNGLPPSGLERDQAVEILQGYGLIVCPTGLGDRKAFKRAAAQGLSAQEYDPNDKAAAEIESVYKFMCKHMKKTTTEGGKNGESQSR